MKKKTLIVISVIWTAIWLCFGISWCSELAHWGEISRHLKARLVMFALFMPLAWLVGLGKLWMLQKDESL